MVVCNSRIYTRMLHNSTVGAQRVSRETSRSPKDPRGNSLAVQRDSANTLPLSGTEGSLRVQKGEHSVLLDAALCHSVVRGARKRIALMCEETA